ncbi:MAG: transglycosylase SLT domain-containing protein [Vulcanimicrobiota bacterium]
MRLRLAALMALLLLAPAAARDWFRPAHAGRDYINADLSPRRALKGPVKSYWDGQLVLWEGRIQAQQRVNGKHRFVLRTPAGEIPVHFPKKVLNLEHDREGFRVAVKGYLELKDGQVTSLSGRSVILLGPPRNWAFTPPTPPASVGDPRLFEFLASWMHFHNPDYKPGQLSTIAAAILAEAANNDLDPLFLASLIQIESAFDIDARSVSGAIGLGQLMPFTAEGLGVDPHDPAQNVAGAAKMISGLIRDWDGNGNPRAMALASYNAGPNLVRQLGGIPRYSQTTNYVYFIGYVHKAMTRSAQAQGALSLSE